MKFLHEKKLEETATGREGLSECLQQGIGTFIKLQVRYDNMPEGKEKQLFLTRLKKADREILKQMEQELKPAEQAPPKKQVPTQPETQESIGTEAIPNTPSDAVAPPDKQESPTPPDAMSKNLPPPIVEPTELVDSPKQAAPEVKTQVTDLPTPAVIAPSPKPVTKPPTLPEPVPEPPTLPEPIKVKSRPIQRPLTTEDWLNKHFKTGQFQLSRQELRACGYRGTFQRIIRIGPFVLTRTLYGQQYRLEKAKS